jgi:hypothetical protein
MVQRLRTIFAAVVLLTCGAGAASAFVLPDPGALAVNPVLDASFWGRPYPYGYTGWGPCIRYVPVQTRWGLALRKVRVCRYTTWYGGAAGAL